MSLNRRFFIKSAFASTVLPVFTGCSINPATDRASFTAFYSIKDEIELGKEEHPKILQNFGGIYNDTKLQSYVDSIGKSLVGHTEFLEYPYSFTILNTPIVNALALPAGRVYITRGLLTLANNEAEMAGVLGHELGHVNARHITERLSQGKLTKYGLMAIGLIGGAKVAPYMDVAQFGMAAYLKAFSRKQEFEADKLGVRYMSKAGYDSKAMVSFLETLKEHSALQARMMGLPAGSIDKFDFMSTHPRTVKRVEAAIKASGEHSSSSCVLARNEYLKRINHMAFGQSRGEGTIKDKKFIHSAMRFEFTVPAGFTIHNEADKVSAVHDNGSAIIFDVSERTKSYDVTSYLRKEWLENKPISHIEDYHIDGFDSSSAMSKGEMNNKKVDIRFFAIDGGEQTVFRFTQITPEHKTMAMAESLKASARSFRRISAEEAAKVKPARLYIRKTNYSDSIANLSKSLPFKDFNEDFFRVLNNMKPDERLEIGKTIKIIQ
ncbi:MAG: M48 family metalloprotease [Alphaproteobacteria bacterium]|nr:M48 family metalloprotease [Alphaproteobacteria bacterium]